jgi:hypothetical protein
MLLVDAKKVTKVKMNQLFNQKFLKINLIKNIIVFSFFPNFDHCAVISF